MAKLSTKRLPRGFVYHDFSSKGGKARHDAWCAEIYYAGVRLRKRSKDKAKAEAWLERTREAISRTMQALPEDISPEVIVEVMRKLKEVLSAEKKQNGAKGLNPRGARTKESPFG